MADIILSCFHKLHIPKGQLLLTSIASRSNSMQTPLHKLTIVLYASEGTELVNWVDTKSAI